jgi:biopolymer transport protein ExbD
MRVTRHTLRKFMKGDFGGSTEVPINLVPMIDILTVLVLYLLVGAIATHLSVLQVALPGKDAAPPPDKPRDQVMVTVRKGTLELGNQFGNQYSAIATFPPLADKQHNYAALTAKLIEIKQRLPREESIVLLLEKDIEYDMLVQVMDAVRQRPKNPDDPLAGYALFPNISFGDAQEAPAQTAQAPAR